MPKNNNHGLVPEVDRRQLLGSVGLAGMAGLAGCASSGGDETATPTDSATPTPSPTVGQSTPTENVYQQLEVGGSAVLMSTSRASSLNPFRSDDTTTAGRINLLFDYPGGTYDRETFLPGLFKSWELSDSNDVVEYELYEGLEFGGDFGEVTAEDYIYALNNLLLLTGDDDWYGYTDTSQYRIGAENELISFEKTGTYSLRAELPVTKPTWLHEDPMKFQWVLPKDFLQQYIESQDQEGLDQDPYITEAQYGEGNLGRYRLVEWNRDSEMVFERNPDWHARENIGQFNAVDYSKAPYFEEVTIQAIDEAATRVAALQSGEVDYGGLPDNRVANFRGEDNDNLDLQLAPFDGGVFWLNINHRINGWEPLRNGDHNHDSQMVRYAIGEAYDPTTLIEEAHRGLGLRLQTMHPQWGPYYPEGDGLVDFEGDLEQARTMLEEGTSSEFGYTNDGTFVNGEGNQVRLQGVRTTGNPAIETEAQFMQQRLEQLGIQYDVESLQWASLLQNYAQNSVENREGVESGDLDWGPIGPFNGGPWDQAVSANDWDLMHGLGFSTSPFAPWGTVKVTMGEQQSFNLWGYHQDEIDIAQQVDDLSTASDRETIQSGMTDLFQFLAEDQPLIFKHSPVAVTAYQDYVNGVVGEQDVDGYDYRLESYFQDIVFDDPITLYAFENGEKP